MVAKVVKKVAVKNAAAPKKAAVAKVAPKKAAAKTAAPSKAVIGKAAAVKAASAGEFVVPPPPHDDQIYIMQSLPGFQVRGIAVNGCCFSSLRNFVEVRNGRNEADCAVPLNARLPAAAILRCLRARRRVHASTRI